MSIEQPKSESAWGHQESRQSLQSRLQEREQFNQEVEAVPGLKSYLQAIQGEDEKKWMDIKESEEGKKAIEELADNEEIQSLAERWLRIFPRQDHSGAVTAETSLVRGDIIESLRSRVKKQSKD